MTDEIFLTQSDPMKVLPPADDQVIGNEYGTVFMNAKTAHKLMALQSVRNETLDRVLGIIDDVYTEWSNNKIDFTADVIQAIEDRVKALEDKTE